jgi:hypothetical protein
LANETRGDIEARRNDVTGAPVGGDKNEALNGASELTARLGVTWLHLYQFFNGCTGFKGCLMRG